MTKLPTMTAWEIVNRVYAMLGVQPTHAAYEDIITPLAPEMYGAIEGLLTVDSHIPVSGILVANEPSVDAIRLAIEMGRNCIISRQHPYYLYGSGWSKGLEKRLEIAKDPVVQAKRKLIEDNRLVIIRLASLWDTARPKWFSSALARTLGWQPEPVDPDDDWSVVYCDIPGTTLTELAQNASSTLQAHALRITGDPKLPVSRVGVIHGFAFPTLVLSHALKDPDVDALVVGSTPEVDYCTTYVRDAIAQGRQIGMVQVGYEKSDYPGAVEVAEWLKPAFPGIPVDVQPQTKELVWLG
ncbi:MAG: Nif3-like dinuclear metal center hexameric protein [Sphingobium sp.]|nr:Nif3-like dinuclear metal center hexameric protein [Sphingobium sp.]MCP5400074.1 Nif3-like dinuclear metal center hexameric protein [Sphingomonas sp.]